LRPDRYALERGDLSKAGAEKSRSLSLSKKNTNLHVIALSSLEEIRSVMDIF